MERDRPGNVDEDLTMLGVVKRKVFLDLVAGDTADFEEDIGRNVILGIVESVVVQDRHQNCLGEKAVDILAELLRKVGNRNTWVVDMSNAIFEDGRVV